MNILKVVNLSLVGKRVLAGLLVAALAGCGSFQNDVNVPLPYYANQLVAECYLRNGVVPQMTVTESVPYLDDGQAVAAGSQILKIENGQTVQLPTDVSVTLTLPGGRTMKMLFLPGINPLTGKYFTHIGTAPITARAGQQFSLDVQDKRGRHITGTAIVPTLIPIDSVRYRFNDLTGDNKRAYFQTKWTDPGATRDYYRLMLHRGKPANNSETDNILTDRLFNGQPYAQVTSYRFRPNDTITATLYHIDSLFYDFRQSIRDARNANGNPFSQPSGIHSTVQGGIGVFAVLVSDERRVVLK